MKDWHSRNAALAHHVGGKRLPSKAHEYMLYQALIGAWPERRDTDFTTRMKTYVLKAAREGKEETSWINPDEGYEAALEAFVGRLLDPAVSGGFLASFDKFAARAALLGALNGLSQLALKILSPGFPDFYQGTEFWDLSLVDPDNRRPVDFSARERAVAGVPSNWPELVRSWTDGRIKLALTRSLLQLRHEQPELFAHGTFVPLELKGAAAEHFIAFSRGLKRQRIVAVIGRHFASLTDGGRAWPSQWDASVHLPGGRFTDALTNQTAVRSGAQKLSDLFRAIPISVLRQV